MTILGSLALKKILQFRFAFGLYVLYELTQADNSDELYLSNVGLHWDGQRGSWHNTFAQSLVTVQKVFFGVLSYDGDQSRQVGAAAWEHFFLDLVVMGKQCV
jgi:hypothetical protein